MPLLGQTMEEGTIIKWFKNEGDKVTAGEPLLEVLTDKVNMEVEAPESGVLRKIITPTEAIVPVKDPICIIAAADESIDDLLSDKKSEQLAPHNAEETSATEQVKPSVEPAKSPVAPVSEERLFSSPSARRIAREKGIDIASLAGKGTGPQGRIVEKDVINFIASKPKATPLAGKMAYDMGINIAEVIGTGVGGKVTSDDLSAAPKPISIPAVISEPVKIGGIIPFTGIRKAVAQNVSHSAQTAPHVTLTSEVDMTDCIKMRTSLVVETEKQYGVKITYTDIIIKAAAKAILDHLIINSSLSADSIIIHDQINIGVATALEVGLVVPVVKDAVLKNLFQISSEVKELVARSKAGHPLPEDYSGGTFTITNLGSYGVDSFNPIITPGQSAILGVCAIKEKPIVVNGTVQIRSMMNLCLSFDHRVLDGAPAAAYLARVKAILESPYMVFI